MPTTSKTLDYKITRRLSLHPAMSFRKKMKKWHLRYLGHVGKSASTSDVAITD